VIKAADRILYIDAYLAPGETRLVPPLLDPAEIKHADLVLGTHPHGDHIDPVAFPGIASASPQARFLVPRGSLDHAAKLGVPRERLVGMDEGLTYEDEAGGMRVQAVAATHEFLDHSDTTGYPYLSYIIQLGGFTILHCGDTCIYEGY